MTENSFNIRVNQRKTLSDGEVTFRFVVDRPQYIYTWSITVYEHKLHKFAYFVQDLEKRLSIVSVIRIHFYFTVILNEMSILRWGPRLL